MKKGLYLLLALVILGSLLIAGCQCDGGTAPAVDVLTLYGIDPWTLDPAVSGDATSHEYIVQIFSGLVRPGDNLEPVPDIAQRWELSPDGRTYTFYLREDVFFHDGRQVTAEDFKYSWERACLPETGSQTAATYLGDIVGAEDVLSGASTDMSGVRVLGDFILEVTSDSPKSYFLSKLTYPTAFVVDRANVALGAGWWHAPNGTGPFTLNEWTEGDVLSLGKNELYYGEMAKVDFVVFQLWGGVPMNMYETGEIDVTGVGTAYTARATDEAGPFYDELTITPELSFYYIGFNTEEPPFDDVNIRRAFSLAIDKEKLISLVFAGTMQPAYGILPPGIPGYNDGLVGLEYDIEEARELIANSSYGDAANLPPITLTTAGWGGLISSDVESLVYQWRENLGVEVTVRQLEPETFLYNLEEEKDEMFYTGWIADYPHPQDFLEVLFSSDAEINYGGYSNPDFDALLEAAAAELDSELGLALYQQAEQMLVDDAVCIPLSFGVNYVLVKPYVSGYQLNLLGFAMLNEVSMISQ
ncbi:MAG: peptide ABC transporter substrate-binding protein [Dehalococcoidales bacterium]|nr:peptide ABC transporter substrate-binding protein [Dehalococcoidales bacterium]